MFPSGVVGVQPVGDWAEGWRVPGSSPSEDKNMEGVLVAGRGCQDTFRELPGGS